MKNSGICFTFFLFICLQLTSQTNGFGIKFGPTIGYQKWGGGSQRDPLLKYHIAAFMDSESSDSKNVLYAQLGYHIKGGAIRFSSLVDIHGNRYPSSTYGMEFHNLSLDIGFKRYLKIAKWKPYYAVGLRGEYTLKTKFEIYSELQEWTCKWNYGFSVKLGSEFKLRKLVRAGIELNLAPDLSKQIFIPASIRRVDPFTGQLLQGYEQSSVNTTIEISLFLRFLQLIEYTD